MAVSLKQKIGQMFILGFRGLAVDEDAAIVRHIREDHLGGVILFSVDVEPYLAEFSTLSAQQRQDTETIRALKQKHRRNVDSPDQVRQLVTRLHQANAGNDLPLFMSVDQEGGRVARLNPDYGFSESRSMAHFGKVNDPGYTHKEVAKMAGMLADLGFNFNLAPVVDVNLNPDNPIIAKFDRSFSPDPRVVAEQALAYIRAHRDHGLFTCIKHFPGHGSACGDTHQGFIDVTEDWQGGTELAPYREIINQGCADAVMIAHVFHRSWHESFPATLSRRVVTEMLRKDLGYDGLVMTDDIQMGALDPWDLAEILQESILAGVDMFIIGNNQKHDPGAFTRAVSLIEDKVARGIIPESFIHESFRRIRHLKTRWMASPIRKRI